jgi:hypothetical protein
MDTEDCHLAKRNGFAMTGPITSPVTKNVICWGHAKDYPFVVFTLQKPS